LKPRLLDVLIDFVHNVPSRNLRVGGMEFEEKWIDGVDVFELPYYLFIRSFLRNRHQLIGIDSQLRLLGSGSQPRWDDVDKWSFTQIE
jgi:hypothetical protein